MANKSKTAGHACGLLRRSPDGSWYYGEVCLGTDNQSLPGALERAIEAYADAPEPVLKAWSPQDSQMTFEWPMSAPIVNVDKAISLHEASRAVFAGLDKGAFCPCCQRTARRYARKFHREMAVFLVYLVRAYRAQPRFYHLREVLPGGRSSPKASTDGSYLTHWGLVKRHKSNAGNYMPTPAGQAFVLGQITVPGTCWVYDGRAWHFSKETVGVREVLDDRVDVLEMLNDNEGPGGR
jgi:hypothetical protein